MTETLSDKRENHGIYLNPPFWVYMEKDVKEFIKDLKYKAHKGFIIGTRQDLLNELDEIIDKLAGEKLI